MSSLVNKLTGGASDAEYKKAEDISLAKTEPEIDRAVNADDPKNVQAAEAGAEAPKV